MSILIKDMEMPKSCEDCMLESYCGLWVLLKDRPARHPDCPLIEVQEPKTGKWEIEICDDGYGAYNVYKCDQCGDLSAQPRNYCRECGARMVIE